MGGHDKEGILSNAGIFRTWLVVGSCIGKRWLLLVGGGWWVSAAQATEFDAGSWDDYCWRSSLDEQWVCDEISAAEAAWGFSGGSGTCSRSAWFDGAEAPGVTAAALHAALPQKNVLMQMPHLLNVTVANAGCISA